MQRETPPAADPPIPGRAIDFNAAKIVRRLVRHGYRAYLVGGCVRDLLLGTAPKDFDIATEARPRQIKRLFRNSRIIGRRFRLVHVRFGQQVIEVSTFRAPPVQEGGDVYIRQDNVFGTEEQDARRRDFTINGLFYDLSRERVIDHVGGLGDLAARRMRTIGDAGVRLREDPVRILRAAKFAGRLGYPVIVRPCFTL
ncbi:MAG: poly(A) polymerase, partial [Planctomycetota bacterium]